ncbi:alanine--tRNA ligase [Candidatus Similichlamydia laticola]|uniref:Alanine--tRNA ligase n=1 Tax=Candidatus Similichlamydia laticola TaxID=2170265 RepID=A0A369KF69_9BACT|nr:alanine--tRNA ligase [Candidatus Similichlamydia laticola]RDB31345.1 Alanyl-tRNA synthetase [Candidatus Similichlamydia laticola]
MLGNEIREAFLQFFQERAHHLFPSSPLLPQTDPTLLFVNAGMNQFKEIFLQKRSPCCSTAVSCQKCLRCGGKHNDIDNVGHTSRHLTFFEMLGNFSFGGYYKEQAIELAWKASLDVFQMDPKRIFVSVLEGDQETAELWSKWIPQQQIWFLGPEDNFWAMGEQGPCGPCSELYYDRGPEFEGATDQSGERYVEFWNIVFMQNKRDTAGQLSPLQTPCIDTGLGLERLCTLLQNVPSVFETDLIADLIQHIVKISGQEYDAENGQHNAPFRVIADHIRSVSFAIADGINPSNNQRGYIIRKLIRRALQYGKKLGLNTPFLGEIFPVLEQKMGKSYPELTQNRLRILEILEKESLSFFGMLKRGTGLMQELLTAGDKTKEPIPGHIAFKLKDTYGVPLEEILLFAKEHDLTLNLEEFKEEETKARIRSREDTDQGHRAHSSYLEKKTPFLGYQSLELPCFLKELKAEDGRPIDQLSSEEKGAVILDRTVFYAQQGGQVGDQGFLDSATGRFIVEETR